jgi:hypothetical protein
LELYGYDAASPYQEGDQDEKTHQNGYFEFERHKSSPFSRDLDANMSQALQRIRSRSFPAGAIGLSGKAMDPGKALGGKAVKARRKAAFLRGCRRQYSCGCARLTVSGIANMQNCLIITKEF